MAFDEKEPRMSDLGQTVGQARALLASGHEAKAIEILRDALDTSHEPKPLQQIHELAGCARRSRARQAADRDARAALHTVGVTEAVMSAVPRIRHSRRHSDACSRERFEICEVVPTLHGDRIGRVLATATTTGGARLAVKTIRSERGLHPSRMRIYDTLRRRWLGPQLREQREEP
jgi:hypothetical protein